MRNVRAQMETKKGGVGRDTEREGIAWLGGLNGGENGASSGHSQRAD